VLSVNLNRRSLKIPQLPCRELDSVIDKLLVEFLSAI
jgi:hypothetical protein